MERFPYPYNNRICYYDAVIEKNPIDLYAFMSTNTEQNPKNGDSFNITFRLKCNIQVHGAMTTTLV